MARKLPISINQEEFEKIFSYTLKNKKSKKKEYALSMLLGFEAGMRISEILGYTTNNKKTAIPPLTKNSVDMLKHIIWVRQGKGMKDRVVPLPKRFNKNALRLLPLPLKRRSLQRWVSYMGEKILGKRISFHTLRHGFGSHLAEMGRPLHEIQALMGHSRLDTTGIYLHTNPKKAVEGAREAF